jgi:hypothetical protein
MADHYWTTIVIGGSIDDAGRDAIGAILQDQFADRTWEGEAVDVLRIATMEEATAEFSGLLRWGNPDEIVTALDEHDLSYRIDIDPGPNAGAEIITCINTVEDTVSARHASDGAGAPLLSITELRAAANKGRTLASLIAELEVHEIPVPALRVKNEKSAQSKEVVP